MSRRTAMNPPTSGPVAAPQLASQLANTLTDALVSGEAALRSLAGVAPRDHRDRAASLLTIYDLHMAPLETVRAVARWQGHPAVADIKFRLEGQWLAELEASYAAADIPAAGLDTVDGAVAAIRAIAAKDRLPTAYRWLANEATWPEVVNFLALEGGPDGGFDDLIALCQVGLAGSAKLELAQNFWDEMGDGDPDGVHTTHRELRPARASLGSGRRGTTLPEPSATPLAGLGRFVPLAKVTPRAPGGSVWTSGDSPFDEVISAVETAGQVGARCGSGRGAAGSVADQPAPAPGRQRCSSRLSRVRRRGGLPAVDAAVLRFHPLPGRRTRLSRDER